MKFILFFTTAYFFSLHSLLCQVNPLTQWQYGNSTFYYESGLMDRTNNSPDSLKVFLTNQIISCESIPIDPHGLGGAWIEIKYPDLTIRNYALGEIWGTMSCWVVGPYYGSCSGYLGTAGLTSVNTGEKTLQGWIDFETDVLGYTVSAEGSFDVPYCETPVSVCEDYYESLPITFALHQNYPNPFNPSTTIKYQVPELSFVTIKVFDVLGSEIATLVSEEKPVGIYEVEFSSHAGNVRNLPADSQGLPSGVYFYKFQSGSLIETKKMILMK